MPRNAEEKFNNEEESLPVLNNFTITTTNTSDNQGTVNTVTIATTTATTFQQQQTTHLEQRKTFEILSKPPANPETTENLLATIETTQTTTTTDSLDSSQVHDEEDFNTTESVSRDSSYPITEIAVTELATTTTATLYPIVIATLDTNPTATTSSLESTAFQPSSTSNVSSSVSGGFLELKKNSPSSLRKRKCQPISFNIKITAKENCRLATLRTRKATAAAHVLPVVDKEAAKGENKQLPVGSSVSAPDRSHLDAELLNKIETLKFEVKKGGNKRKRINTNIGTRKRLTRKKVANTTNYNYNWCAEAKEEEHVAALSPNEVEDSTVSTDSNTTTVTNISNKKRPRIMSLYERRYQNDEARSSGVVSNGLTSTRNSSASSSSAMHADAADSPDISNQYYMSASSAAAAAAAVGSGTALGSNGSSSAAVSASTSTIAHVNHAPSMATLCNIGNTCYLNSVVYTLRFAPHFLHNLHHLMVDLSTIQQNIVRQRAAKSSSLGRGISAVHMENARSWSNKDLASMEQYPNSGGNGGGAGGVGAVVAGSLTQKSSHQLLTEKLHELYQSLHRNELSESMEPYHADTLLHAIQDVSSIFEGNQQQDAHEFLMCLLNSIRETSQTLIKTIAECPDVIVNGYIANPDEVDAAYNLEKDSTVANNHALSGSGGGGNGGSSSSSLSTSNITKAYFFSRKSKRKEEGKNSKNSRLQSPLKDGSNVMQPQLQPASNSLFYLNTVDLIGGGSNSQSNSNSNSTTAAALKSSQIVGGADDEASSPVSLLKDKERLNEKIRELGLDFFSEDFEGVTVSTTKCLSCETITEQKESMIDIAVPVPISGYDSSDYTEKPSSFIQNSCITREYFRGENKYRCEQCTGYTEAIRSISYEVLPRLLVIQLSRFSGGMEKINSYIPTSFTLQCFCAKCCELSDANKLHIYKLYSVITHVGATMSVGHYIAYTCSLDWSNGYVNCPKDRRSSAQQQQQQQQQQQNPTANGLLNNGTSAVIAQSASAASAAASVIASSGTSLMKKMKFGRSKASSSGDMSKNIKNLNGITSKTITNGIGKLSMNTTCHSLNCCATRLTSSVQQNAAKGSSDLSEESLLLPNGSNHSSNFNASGYNNFSASSGYGSTGRGTGVGGSKTSFSTSSSIALTASGPSAEPIWYMCDDDKIKAMTQREFEELLSPSRKITITPYLLFYARFDLQTPQSTTPPKQATTPPQPSWSSDSLQSGLHKM